MSNNELTPELKVEALQVYPLTGAREVPVKSTVINKNGLINDRYWVLYDPETNLRVSARQAPDLRKISFVDMTDSFTVDFGNELGEQSGNLYEIPRTDKDEVGIKEFGDLTPAFDLGDTAANTFSEFLGKSVRLARKNLSKFNTAPRDRANAPIHMVSTETLLAISAETGIDCDELIKRFRPNIVLSSNMFFERDSEQEWRILSVAETALKLIVHRPTARCPVPSQNPLNGEDKSDIKLASLPKFIDPRNGKAVRSVGVYAYPEFSCDRKIDFIGMGQKVRILSNY